MFHKIANTVYGQGVGLIAGVKNLLPPNSDLPLTKAVDALINNRESADVEKFLYLDPRAPKGRRSSTRPSTPFSQAIAFVLGGACYVEYQNLQDYAHKNSEKGLAIAYGGTEIVSPEQFLSQLSALGAADSASANLPVD
jgi:hypothetical protein